jgi:hypothetical protein
MENEKLKRPLQAILIAPNESVWENIILGKKKITIREGWRDYQPGFSILGCHIANFCVGADITDVKHCLAKDVTEEEYHADGYTSQDNMIDDLHKYYPNLSLESKVTVIKWNNIYQSDIVKDLKEDKK